MNDRQKNKKKTFSLKPYVVFLSLFVLLLEILYNVKHFTPSLTVIVGWFFTVLGSVGGVSVFPELKNMAQRFSRWIITWNRSARRCLLGKMGVLTLPEHFVYAIIEKATSFIKPLLKSDRRAKLITILFFLSPVLASWHPYRNSAKIAIHTVKDLNLLLGVEVEDAAQTDIVDVPDEPETDDPEPYADPAENPDEETSTNHTQPTKKSTTNFNSSSGEPVHTSATFWITKDVTDEDIQNVKKQILYFSENAMTKSALEIRIKNQLLDLASGKEPAYMSIFFPNGETASDETDLYYTEDLFLDALKSGQANGITEIPNDDDLQEVIEGRERSVRLLKSGRMAFVLANNYLMYIEEYEKQQIRSKKQIYYSGMAILSAELQLCYREKDMPVKNIIDWIYTRYKEISDMEMTNDTILDDIIEVYDTLRYDTGFIQMLEAAFPE